jgi:hypothetical protein
MPLHSIKIPLDLHEICEKYGGYWDGEHPDYPIRDWIYDVTDKNVRSGYWEWVRYMIISNP